MGKQTDASTQEDGSPPFLFGPLSSQSSDFTLQQPARPDLAHAEKRLSRWGLQAASQQNWADWAELHYLSSSQETRTLLSAAGRPRAGGRKHISPLATYYMSDQVEVLSTALVEMQVLAKMHRCT